MILEGVILGMGVTGYVILLWHILSIKEELKQIKTKLK